MYYVFVSLMLMFHGFVFSFLFAESTKLTSLGGEQSLASMIGSLFDALEKKYGTLVTRLYKVYGTEKGQIL